MWISAKVLALLDSKQTLLDVTNTELTIAREKAVQLEAVNARQRADIDWFKHRLNQVERERAQLIMAASGVKISAPEFVEAPVNPSDVLNEMQADFAMVGADAPDEDYAQMPQRARN